MSLFEAYNQQQAQQSYVPQQRANLQTAYNQALGQRTPNWAIHLSNAMPSIAEIIAAGTTKGAFNQGRIADSLERQKNRQIAYTQALQNMEDNRVKDYVQMAKDQLNFDIADEQQTYDRQMNDIERNDKLNAQERAYNQWLDQFGYQQEKDKRDYDEDVRRFNKNMERLADRDWIADRNADRTYNLDKRKVELAEQQAQQEAAANTEQAKARQKQLDGYVSTAEEMFKKGLIDNETLWAIKKNPELAEKLVPKSSLFWTSSKKMELDNSVDNSYEILQDKDGNLARVYKDGRIEEI